MKKITILLICIIVVSVSTFSQGKLRISGFVKEKETGEVLIGANIIQTETSNGVASDENGFFSIIVETPSEIQISFIGYATKTIKIDYNKDTLVQIYLEKGNQLNEVIVSSEGSPKFNVTKLGINELSLIPSLSGKADIAKGLQLMPGIASPNEGSSQLLVRGGDIGQNLYLFDNVPIIHVNHLGGFISVFNPDIINGIEVYKGGFPSKYGGRLSSIMNITQREGDKSLFKGSFNIGITDAALTLEGPFALKNSSFIVTARKTMVDALMATFTKLSDANDFTVMYGFHDFNGKLSWKPNTKNSFNLNFYQGDDYLHHWVKLDESYIDLTTKAHSGINWGNWLGSFKWNRVISSKLFMTTSISYTRYRLRNKSNFEISDTSQTITYSEKLQAIVQDYSFRSAFQYKLLKNWAIDFGLQSSYFIHSPSIVYKSDLDVQPLANTIHSSESAIYLENNFCLFNKIYANIGARYVHYYTNGFQDLKLEPRVNLNYNFYKNQTINFSYMNVNQFSHLIFTTGDIMNNELWVPSNSSIKPAGSNQYSIGWHGEFLENRYLFEVNAYYKELYNLATIKEGYSGILGDENWQNKIESGGSGTARGLEFLFRKNAGRIKGFASYTLSNSTRQYDNINNGEEFLFDFDRLHSLSLSVNYDINDKLNLNVSWVYQTGLPFTPLIGRQITPYTNENTYGSNGYYEVFTYGDRNSDKMKDYHRLDIGLTYSTKTKRRGLPVEWTFSIYNAYNRQNPYNYFYGHDQSSGIYFNTDINLDERKISLYQVSYLPIIPSFSYKVYFNENTLKNDNKLKLARKQKKETERKDFDGSSYIKNRWGIKLGYTILAPINFLRMRLIRHTPFVYSLETNYGFSNYFTGGIYLGYSQIHYQYNQFNENTQEWEDINFNEKAFSYNAKLNFHILPLIIKKAHSKCDLYSTLSVGGYYYIKNNYFQYNTGVGFAFYPKNHLGLYIEWNYGNYLGNSFNVCGGLAFKFYNKKYHTKL
ncbi:MAG: TonB-dependent receptor [Bacteroidales bacterium]|nr:TonB-dependent receptor [Bacteroidales bacterium]